MAEKLEIVVTLLPDGTVHLETHGLQGQSCLDETAALEKALGRVSRREKTAEFWRQTASATSSVKRG